MSVRIDRKLNLVVQIEREGAPLYIHSMPISREVFETYFLIISRTFATLYSQQLNILAGPRVAAMLLKKLAEGMGAWDGEGGVQQGLVAEIRRLSNVVMPTEAGWQTVPLEDALKRGLIDADDFSEAEGAITFFIVASVMHRRNQVPAVLEEVCGLWGTKTTSLNVTEFVASLPTLTPDASSGAMAAASSVPS